MILVYIASPYSIGNQAANVRRQIDAYRDLVQHGYVPYAPLLSHFVDLVYPMAYSRWMQIDREIILRCDALLRLPGESEGADKETAFAREHKIPVVESIEELRLKL